MLSQNPFVDQLLVEGKNDRHVIWALCKHYAVPQTFKVETIEDGIESLLRELSPRLKRPGMRKLGVVIDADENPTQRWQAVSNRLQQIGYLSIPKQPDTAGFVLDSLSLPRIGVWMMPNNALTGNIEDFSRLLIDSADPLILMAEETVAALEQRNMQRYRPAHRSKSLLHTWLAWQDPPGMPMGTALTAKALNPESPLAAQFVDWIQRLFVSHIPAREEDL
ncbi:MAG: hypothetical protein DWI57_04410 [Chloroflexi bacterium]|nr:MAG: hypothetical protein DWI57_04410 [Chloroflexota bacterium]